MTTYVANLAYGAITPDDGFKLAQSVLPDAGFTIWKERPIGWLLIANQQTTEGIISATLSFRSGAETVLNISLSCDEHTEQSLKQAADRFIALFENRLPA
jgi:hypothetical protein